MDDTILERPVPKAAASASALHQAEQVGTVAALSGFKVSCALFGGGAADGKNAAYERAQIGTLIKMPTPRTVAFGFVDSLALHNPTADDLSRRVAMAEVQFLGELIPQPGGAPPVFSRGISVYPVLGAPVFPASADDLARIYAKPNTWTLPIGTLYQDASKTAYLMSQELLCKHSAILGTTGSGKSCALTIILRSLLTAHPNGHVVLLDPHGEYAPAFKGMAEIVTPQSLEMPYWLLNYEEIVEILCSREPIARSREANILKEAIVAAKRDFLGPDKDDIFLTVDTPLPYRMQSVLGHLSTEMGKLDKPDSSLPYLRLITTIEGLRHDKRYRFMFGNMASGLMVRDNMAEILARILRIPVSGKPITILDISAVPSEIVNVVVSLLARVIFEFALWSERAEAVPLLLVCDEAHRYIPQDESLGFQPTRRAIARIAKEGRKYGISLCLVTQRPSEISEAILSQCSTVFALRMTNEKDQNFVRRCLPETAAGLLNTLPTLRLQEAIAVGEGVPHPMRIRFANLDPDFRPKGDAANFPKAWEDDKRGRPFISTIIERWRWPAH